MSEHNLQPGNRFKFPNFDKTYRVLDWKSLSNLLEVIYGPFHIRLLSGELKLLDQIQQGFAVEEQSGVILALVGDEKVEVLNE